MVNNKKSYNQPPMGKEKPAGDMMKKVDKVANKEAAHGLKPSPSCKHRKGCK